MISRTPHQDAIRLLFILNAGSARHSDPSLPDVVAIFRGEAILHALDFWMRNPDYLAAEQLDLFRNTGVKKYLAAADEIFAKEEPDLRRVPMSRYFFGAFDRLDNTLSLLRSRDLVRKLAEKHLKKSSKPIFSSPQQDSSFAKKLCRSNQCCSGMLIGQLLLPNWPGTRAVVH